MHNINKWDSMLCLEWQFYEIILNRLTLMSVFINGRNYIDV